MRVSLARTCRSIRASPSCEVTSKGRHSYSWSWDSGDPLMRNAKVNIVRHKQQIQAMGLQGTWVALLKMCQGSSGLDGSSSKYRCVCYVVCVTLLTLNNMLHSMPLPRLSTTTSSQAPKPEHWEILLASQPSTPAQALHHTVSMLVDI